MMAGRAVLAGGTHVVGFCQVFNMW